MSYELIASGGVLDATSLARYEDQIKEDQKGLLELDLRLAVSSGVAQQLEDILKEKGVEGVRVTTASPMLKIYFRKGFPWLAVIAAAVLGLIVLAVLIVGWRIYKDVVASGVSGSAIIGAGVLVLIVAGLALVLIMRRR